MVELGDIGSLIVGFFLVLIIFFGFQQYQDSLYTRSYFSGSDLNTTLLQGDAINGSSLTNLNGNQSLIALNNQTGIITNQTKKGTAVPNPNTILVEGAFNSVLTLFSFPQILINTVTSVGYYIDSGLGIDVTLQLNALTGLLAFIILMGALYMILGRKP